MYNSFGTTTYNGGESPTKVTQSPTTTGTSVLAMKFDGGIIFAADTLGSYGSLARYRDCERLMKVNENTMIGCMGDYADFQYVRNIVEQLSIDDTCKDDNFAISPRSLHSWLTRVLYNKRSKFDPLWTNFVVGGIEKNGEAFLGFVDKLGLAYKDPIIATGYGMHIALPIMRSEWKENLTQPEAENIIEKCLKVLYYRDARAYQKYQVGVVTSAGAEIKGPFEVKPDWTVAHLISGFE